MDVFYIEIKLVGGLKISYVLTLDTVQMDRGLFDSEGIKED